MQRLVNIGLSDGVPLSCVITILEREFKMLIDIQHKVTKQRIKLYKNDHT